MSSETPDIVDKVLEVIKLNPKKNNDPNLNKTSIETEKTSNQNENPNSGEMDFFTNTNKSDEEKNSESSKENNKLIDSVPNTDVKQTTVQNNIKIETQIKEPNVTNSEERTLEGENQINAEIDVIPKENYTKEEEKKVGDDKSGQGPEDSLEIENKTLLSALPLPNLDSVPSIDTLKENVLNLVGNFKSLEDHEFFKQDIACQTDFNEDNNEQHVHLDNDNGDNVKNQEIKAYTSSTESITKNCNSTDDAFYGEEVELRKNKRLNITVALRNSFNGKKLRNSFRNRKCKSESSNAEGKKFSLTFKDLAIGVTALLQPQKVIGFALEQPPAPLVVEDPPSDNEGAEGEEIKNPNLLNGSSGNFTSTPSSGGSSNANSGSLQSNAGGPAARSAPSTPQGLLNTPPNVSTAQTTSDAPPASPSAIQRSPSHAVFSKVDKTNLKHLSTSTPVMTAQGQLAEPPSPKATKDPKVHTTSKARQKKFARHFPNVEDDEKVLNHYSCALIGDILLQGHLYITKNYFAFYSNVFGYVTKLLIPILTVEDITKEKTARIIPNAVGIVTLDDKHIFGSLMSRDSTLAYMRTVWQKAKAEEIIPEPDIVEPEDPDISESSESGRESPLPELAVTGSPHSTPTFAFMKKLTKDGTWLAREYSSTKLTTDQPGPLQERKGSKGFIRTLKDAIAEFRKLPRQNLILVATTLLLVLLFLSAAVLLYRINRIQNRFSLSIQEGGFPNNNGGDVYGNLLRWQAQLHSKSADAVNNLLDSNLDQISKVRQSLEALSMLLVQSDQNMDQDKTVRIEQEHISSPPEKS